ncbi:MAG TPA: hypothetical protein VD931_20760 [Baekduia sp.]|nr:hypothetical protein [Baekduia sp.]
MRRRIDGPAGQRRVVAGSTAVQAGAAEIETFAAQIPVRAGQRVGVQVGEADRVGIDYRDAGGRAATPPSDPRSGDAGPGRRRREAPPPRACSRERETTARVRGVGWFSKTCPALVAVVVLLAPASAGAQSSGSFSATAEGLRLTVAGQAAFDCEHARQFGGNGTCDWFEAVHIVPASQPCGRQYWHAGQVARLSPRPFRSRQRPYGWTAEKGRPPIRICLYVEHEFFAADFLIAEAVLDTRVAGGVSSTPVPQPAPPAQRPRGPFAGIALSRPHFEFCGEHALQEEAQRTFRAERDGTANRMDPDEDGIACELLPTRVRPPRLTIARARRATRAVLLARLGPRFRHRTGLRMPCDRRSPTRVRCRPAWRAGGRWRASVLVRSERRRGQDVLRWDVTVRHAQHRARTTAR